MMIALTEVKHQNGTGKGEGVRGAAREKLTTHKYTISKSITTHSYRDSQNVEMCVQTHEDLNEISSTTVAFSRNQKFLRY